MKNQVNQNQDINPTDLISHHLNEIEIANSRLNQEPQSRFFKKSIKKRWQKDFDQKIKNLCEAMADKELYEDYFSTICFSKIELLPVIFNSPAVKSLLDENDSYKQALFDLCILIDLDNGSTESLSAFMDIFSNIDKLLKASKYFSEPSDLFHLFWKIPFDDNKLFYERLFADSSMDLDNLLFLLMHQKHYSEARFILSHFPDQILKISKHSSGPFGLLSLFRQIPFDDNESFYERLFADSSMDLDLDELLLFFLTRNKDYSEARFILDRFPDRKITGRFELFKGEESEWINLIIKDIHSEQSDLIKDICKRVFVDDGNHKGLLNLIRGACINHPKITEKLLLEFFPKEQHNFSKMQELRKVQYMIEEVYSSNEFGKGASGAEFLKIFQDYFLRSDFTGKEKFEDVVNYIVSSDRLVKKCRMALESDLDELEFHDIKNNENFDKVTVIRAVFIAEKIGDDFVLHQAYHSIYYKDEVPVLITYCDGNLPRIIPQLNKDSPDPRGEFGIKLNENASNLDVAKIVFDIKTDMGLTEVVSSYSDKFKGVICGTNWSISTKPQKRDNCQMKSTNILIRSLLSRVHPNEFGFEFDSENPSSEASLFAKKGIGSFKEYKDSLRDLCVGDAFELAKSTKSGDPYFEEVNSLIQEVFLQSVKKGHIDIVEKSMGYLKDFGVDWTKIKNDQGQGVSELIKHDLEDDSKRSKKQEMVSFLEKKGLPRDKEPTKKPSTSSRRHDSSSSHIFRGKQVQLERETQL